MKRTYFFSLIILGSLLLSGCQRNKHTSPQRKDLVDAVFASGNIEMTDHYLVTAQSEGYLKQLFVDAGDSVSVGQRLFYIQDDAQQAQLESAQAAYRQAADNKRPDSPILQKLSQQLIQAKNQLRNDSVNFVRYQNLIDSHAVSQADYDIAQLIYENSRAGFRALQNTWTDTKKNLEVAFENANANRVVQQNNSSYFTLASQVDGIVLQKMKEDGELVRRGETLAEIGSGSFIARLLIAEEDIIRINPGQDVFIELNTEKDKSYKARITKVYPAFDTKSQSFVAEAEFSEQVPSVKSGTQLQGNIVIGQKQQALVIPSSYLLPNDHVVHEGSEEKIQVKTGIKNSEWVEILSGLSETDVLTLSSKK